MSNKKTMLIILDGWGIGKKDKSDAIYNGDTPNMDSLQKDFPCSTLLTCGEDVGLPEGQMGNSEVGHLNIGAGRVVYQDLVRINKAIRDNSINDNLILKDALSYAKSNNKAVHFIGLVSSGGVHSMDNHLYKLVELADSKKIENIFIHAITDGRDTDPRSGFGYVESLCKNIEGTNAKIASLIGRYYTMDRDKRWERVKEGYDLMVNGKGQKSDDVLKAIKQSYKEEITDEFIKPVVFVNDSNEPLGLIKPDDVVICFNFRTDRLREITMTLTQQDFPEFDMFKMPLHYLTMTRYDDKFKNVKIIYDKDNVSNTLGEVLANKGKKQIRIAETEKYAHVTFFFSGGRELEFDGEKRILIPSPKVATYDLKPEMSAYEVKDAILPELEKQEADFICLNFANGDMVGHTGIYPAILKAVKTVDNCVGEVVKAARRNNYDVVIIADHGNADYTINNDGSPNTAHSLFPVPIILVSDRYKEIKAGILADVAPTILTIMGEDIPMEMTGKSLV